MQKSSLLKASFFKAGQSLKNLSL